MTTYVINPEDNDLLEEVRRFAQNEIKEQCKAYDVSGEFPWEIIKKAQEMGLGALEVEEKYGGPGLSNRTVAALYEEIAYADAGVASTLMATNLAFKTVTIAGNEEQIAHASELIVNGSLGAFCLTEPDAGSDAANNKTVAVKDGDSYVLNGRKCFITNGGVSDFYVVFAMTDKSLGVKGMSAFLVDRDTKGLSFGHEENKMGIRCSNTCDVVFEDCRIPADRLMGLEGKGFFYAMQTLDCTRIGSAVGAVGIARRALDEAVAYSKQRVTFGKPIGKHEAIQFKIADMQTRVDSARALVAYAYDLMEAGLPYATAASEAKCLAGDNAVANALEAIQILGGYGYSREYPVEKLLRDAKIFQIFEGTNEVQRMVIGRNVIGKFE